MVPVRRHHLVIGQNIFATAGILCLCYWATATVRERSFQARKAHTFDEKSRAHETRIGIHGSPKPSARAKVDVPAEGSPIARLAIPDLRMALMVVEGVSHQGLAIGPRHIPGTALPGHPATSGLLDIETRYSGR